MCYNSLKEYYMRLLLIATLVVLVSCTGGEGGEGSATSQKSINSFLRHSSGTLNSIGLVIGYDDSEGVYADLESVVFNTPMNGEYMMFRDSAIYECICNITLTGTPTEGTISLNNCDMSFHNECYDHFYNYKSTGSQIEICDSGRNYCAYYD